MTLAINPKVVSLHWCFKMLNYALSLFQFMLISQRIADQKNGDLNMNPGVHHHSRVEYRVSTRGSKYEHD